MGTKKGFVMIRVKFDVKERLEKLKFCKKDTYNEIIERLIEVGQENYNEEFGYVDL